MYRRYEDPRKLEDILAEAEERLRQNPEDDYLAQDVAELRDRVNFAWQDEYQED